MRAGWGRCALGPAFGRARDAAPEGPLPAPRTPRHRGRPRVGEEHLLRPELPDPGELLVREASDAQGMLRGAAEVDLGALRGELPLDGRKLEDCLAAGCPGIGRAETPHDLALAARIGGEQFPGDTPAHVMDAVRAALEYASVFCCFHDLPPVVVQTV